MDGALATDWSERAHDLDKISNRPKLCQTPLNTPLCISLGDRTEIMLTGHTHDFEQGWICSRIWV